MGYIQQSKIWIRTKHLLSCSILCSCIPSNSQAASAQHNRCSKRWPPHLLALIVRGGQVLNEVPAKSADLVPHVRRKVRRLGHVL